MRGRHRVTGGDRRHTILFCNKIAQLLRGSSAPTDMLANSPEPNLGTVQPTQDFTGVFTVREGWKWSAGVNGVDRSATALYPKQNRSFGKCDGCNRAIQLPNERVAHLAPYSISEAWIYGIGPPAE